MKNWYERTFEYIFVTNIFEYSNIRIYSSHSVPVVSCLGGNNNNNRNVNYNRNDNKNNNTIDKDNNTDTNNNTGFLLNCLF